MQSYVFYPKISPPIPFSLFTIPYDNTEGQEYRYLTLQQMMPESHIGSLRHHLSRMGTSCFLSEDYGFPVSDLMVSISSCEKGVPS